MPIEIHGTYRPECPVPMLFKLFSPSGTRLLGRQTGELSSHEVPTATRRDFAGHENR